MCIQVMLGIGYILMMFGGLMLAVIATQTIRKDRKYSAHDFINDAEFTSKAAVFMGSFMALVGLFSAVNVKIPSALESHYTAATIEGAIFRASTEIEYQTKRADRWEQRYNDLMNILRDTNKVQ